MGMGKDLEKLEENYQEELLERFLIDNNKDFVKFIMEDGNCWESVDDVIRAFIDCCGTKWDDHLMKMYTEIVLGIKNGR